MISRMKTPAPMAIAGGAATLGAQDNSNYAGFAVDGKTIRVHGFVSEGFLAKTIGAVGCVSASTAAPGTKTLEVK